MQNICTGEVYIDKIIIWKIAGEIVPYIDNYFQLTPSDEQKVIRELHQDSKKKPDRQKNLISCCSACLSPSTAMVYLPPLS